ncbi:acyltransferase family protein [Paenibacillus radicis (ex Gao et al. 2016)]|uniref:Acyltransferase n=1 Tax=Paenibacillus radicis (ex Gao et al. 2016) TaxID=1737354 RepID=A0A917HTS6_9BACL|nr:acyltransferase [Paenibacillus radicis (ex Gao et al. 2016)]GGG90180.1 acyltransferase [Paenibacillus radicis (ex Gao et al. 2016)]
MNKNRIGQLDAMRGLAAIAVIFSHYYLVEVKPALSDLLFKFSPLGFIKNGHGAVILFFLLSGFVLMLPFLKNSAFSYRTFLLKRILRIYVPFWFAMVFSILLSSWLSTGGIPALSTWFNSSWNEPTTVKSVVENLLLIGNYNSNLYNNVIWSLVQEMRISIIFPLLALIIMKWNWKTVLGLCLALSAISGTKNIFGYDHSYGFHTGFVDTLHYATIFLIGGLLAKHREFIVGLFVKSSKAWKWSLLGLAYILFTYSELAMAVGNRIGLRDYQEILDDYTTAASCVILIVIALGSARVTKLLSVRIIAFFGDISYSLYLYHLLVLFSFIYLLYGKLPLAIIYVLAFIWTILIAAASYNYIEAPAIKWGKRIGKRSNKGAHQPSEPVAKLN